jgi:hypothetical protein
MKKTLIIALGLITALTGCEKYLEKVAESPNDPLVVTPSLLLTGTEVATFSTYSGQLARLSSILVQQSAGTDFQFVDIANYQIREGNNVNEWEVIYTDALMNAQLIINDFGDASPYYGGIARILKAMNLGIATDLWGDIPNSEALTGLDEDPNFNPAYDSQEAVLANIQTLLDEAIVELSKPATDNRLLPASDDLVFGGDPDMWIRTAYILKARYYNRLSQTDPAGSASNALAALTSAGLTGTSDDANAYFGTNGNELNQWYAFQNSRGGYMQMGSNLIDMMNNTADPRLPMYSNTDSSGVTYTGTASDANDTWTSTIGSAFASPASSAPMVTYVEAKFIEAEAKFRSGDAPGAATAHNEAILASLTLITGENDSAYVVDYASETNVTITLEKVMTQKYVASFTQIESWTDWRRTGFPVLTANPSASENGIPLRLPTPISERVNNTSAVVVSDILSPVWWDQ